MVTSLQTLVAARGLALTRFAYLLCGDGHRAEDLVQTALERTWKRWSRVVSVDRPEAYVRQVIVREFVSSRRLRSASEVVMADLPDAAAVEVPSVGSEDEMWRALATLPKTQRAVLVLRY